VRPALPPCAGGMASPASRHRHFPSLNPSCTGVDGGLSGIECCYCRPFPRHVLTSTSGLWRKSARPFLFPVRQLACATTVGFRHTHECLADPWATRTFKTQM